MWVQLTALLRDLDADRDLRFDTEEVQFILGVGGVIRAEDGQRRVSGDEAHHYENNHGDQQHRGDEQADSFDGVLSPCLSLARPQRAGRTCIRPARLGTNPMTNCWMIPCCYPYRASSGPTTGARA